MTSKAAQFHSENKRPAAYRPPPPPPPQNFPSARHLIGESNPSPFQGFNRFNTRLRSPFDNASAVPQGLGFLTNIYAEEEDALHSVNLGFLSTAGMELGQLIAGIVGEFSGRPKAEDTIQAAQRLMMSRNPYVQLLGQRFAYLANHGVVLSDSNPAVQKLISDEFHAAVLALEASLGWSQNRAFWALENVISSHTANAGTTIPISRAEAQTAPLPQTRALVRPMPQRFPQPTGPLDLIPRPPDLQTQIRLVNPEVGELVSLIGAQMNGTDGFVKNFFSGQGQGQGQQLQTYPQNGYPPPANVTNGYSRQPFANPQPFQPFQPAPELKPCADCGYRPDEDESNQLRRQTGELEQEVRVEQQQQLRERIAQQERTINSLRQLERNQPSGRNIPQELEQKQQLLRDISSEERGQYPDNSYSQPSGPNAPATIDTGYRSAPIEVGHQHANPPPSETQQEIFTQGQGGEDGNPEPNGPDSVKFCVVCSNVNESHKFLNGEPSECSVLTQ